MQLLDFTPGHEAVIPAYESHGAYPPSRQLLPNPRVQPTGRGGLGFARAQGSWWPGCGSIDWCGRNHDRLQLLHLSLGRPNRRSEDR